MSLCLLATAMIFIATSAEASPTVVVIPGNIDKRLTDPRCATCSDDCPPYCGPITTPHPVTEPPCHDCHDTCPPYHKPPPKTKFPNLPSITYSTNCDFCEHDLYTLTCVATPFHCAARCAVDLRCSHFTYIANLKGGTCVLKKAFGSGGAWASSIPSPSPYVCGYIPSRALIGIFLNICVGLDITGSGRN
ncbi:hypothetical protein DAPPUDRAFT_316885 [Daphnia pulex]|uniref:Apple domain-containing protein n=1 Tax=Daphnia pulex TaxID=6669 RepID=E9GE98_DAPPU|nr:hypothetical protein DAPPUDRAFT_316885 [Daphnia pulex]|eukprot:EFX82350.1 hypothetical protein DAPPUDRAFT_316885 [Daphnia pulex]